MTYRKMIPLVVAATLLAGCGQVMESTANLLDTAAEKIEGEEESELKTVEAIEESKQQGVVTETVVAPSTKEETKPVEQKKKQPVFEKHDTVMDIVIITAEKGNVRAEPSIDAPIVASSTDLEAVYMTYLKERVKTLDGRTWYKVNYGRGIGYISSAVSELSMKGDPPTIQGLKEVEIIEAKGNVREEPYMNSPVIYTGKKGERLKATSAIFDMPDGRTWYMVELNGRYGYISERVISEIYDADMAYQHIEDIFYITSAEGNVRAQASLQSPIIYTANKGERLSYMGTYEHTSDGRTWYSVYVNGQYGYISGAVGEVR